MSKKAKLVLVAIAGCLALGLAAVNCGAQGQANKTTTAPQGWFLAGTKPAEFQTGVDSREMYKGHASAFLKSRQQSVDGFGTLMQSITAEKYVGKRVRLSGMVKTVEVIGHSGLWLRVDRMKKGATQSVIDNMNDRPIQGTTSWRRYDVVLDVPEDATGISFGLLLDGVGQVWLSGTKFEIVGMDVATTNTMPRKVPDAPINLDFAK